MLKLVPFSAAWVDSHKLDLKAIYRRPQWVMNEFDEWVKAVDADGNTLWDLTTPLRVMQHNKHEAKGFEYVTLASREDLMRAAHAGTIPGNWREYDQHQTGGPWNAKMYQSSAKIADTAATQQLREDILQYGWETVEALRRRSDPAFRVPDVLKPKAEAVAVTEGEPVATTSKRKTVNA
jgi:hypothetical protein